MLTLSFYYCFITAAQETEASQIESKYLQYASTGNIEGLEQTVS